MGLCLDLITSSIENNNRRNGSEEGQKISKIPNQVVANEGAFWRWYSVQQLLSHWGAFEERNWGRWNRVEKDSETILKILIHLVQRKIAYNQAEAPAIHTLLHMSWLKLNALGFANHTLKY